MGNEGSLNTRIVSRLTVRVSKEDMGSHGVFERAEGHGQQVGELPCKSQMLQIHAAAQQRLNGRVKAHV